MAVSARGLRAGRAIIELGLTGSKAIEQSLNNLKARVQTIGRSFSQVGGIGGGAMGGGGLAGLRNLFVGSAATAALVWPVKLAAGLQLSAAQMEAFAGSGEVANKMILDLQEFSAVAFQSLDSLITQARVLMSRGIKADEAVADIKAIAAIAAGSSDEFEQLTKAFADVKNATVLTGEEMRQFKNTAFNPLIEIGKRTGETMVQLEKRLKDQGISFGEVNAALQASVRAGGLFNGILDKIAGTLLGQMKKAWAQFQLAVLPLGNELLAPLTKFFRAISGIMPVVAAFVKEHSGVAKVILGTLAAVAVAAVAFTAMGLSMTLASIAAAGIAAAFGAIAAALGIVLSLPGILAGSLAYLAFQFFTTTESGRAMVNDLANYFTGLVGIAKKAFQGIADAMQAGDIQLAGEILWAGLKLAWIQGTYQLNAIWQSFKTIGVRTIIEMSFDVQSQFASMATAIQAIWNKMVTAAKTTGEKIGHYLSRSSDPVVAAAQDRAHEMALQNIQGEGAANQQRISGERQRAIQDIEDARRQAEAVEDKNNFDEVLNAKRELEAAKKRLADLTDKARAEAEGAPGAKNWFGEAGKFAGAMAGLNDAKAMKPEALFDTRLAPQTFGGGDSVQQQQLNELRGINKGVGHLGGGGLPFI